ncbi:flavin-containing monooxygenase [Halobacillus seohaensis]|uniref:Flavin-containing monooxygenase n=1 Tax=Halobacillus seohaensis TaxID=447421 RepID=A0ABW2EJT6_9BACI
MVSTNQHQAPDYDAIVIGAGFSGLYMLHRLREAGYSVRVYEAADGVGGVWYWNRYPGARCDSESIYYNYTFSEELYREWTWSSRYPKQSEILDYLNFVADKFELRTDIQFDTKIKAAHYDETNHKWNIETGDGNNVSAKYFITGVGCLSAANIPNIKGKDTFTGESYHTGHWPHEGVDFKGKHVGIIGTGSSGIQSIPVIAKEADHLTVFQRTPQYSTPAKNHPYDLETIEYSKENFYQIKEQMRNSPGGIPAEFPTQSALENTQEERQEVFEEAWEKGGFYMQNTYNDITINEDANETLAEFVRSKIRETVHDQKIAEKLMPSYYYGTKRPVLDTNYFETFNRTNVSLIDLKNTPIHRITEKGVQTTEEEYELDTLIFATGYDAMTGPLLKIDIRGREGVSLKEKWGGGAQTKTYLGLTNAGFPNMFMITGPESPSVLSNMPVSIEQHVEWIADCIDYLCEHNIDYIEATPEAENAWSTHCREVAEATLFTKTESWYTGANIEGKPRGFLIYLGGVGAYREKCSEIANEGYPGFTMVISKKLVI